MKVVVIGGGASGMMFSSQYKRKNPEHEVWVYEKSKFVSWAGCPTPYYLAGELSFDHVVLRKPEDFIKKGINVNIESEVESVNFDEKYIVVKGEKVTYDKLVLAVGARARLKIGMILTHAQNALEIEEKIKDENVKKVAIVGGGFVGLELAETFIKKGKKVSLVEAAPAIFPVVSEDIKTKLYEKMDETGLDYHLGVMVDKFNEKDLVLKDGTKIDFDLLITSIGITPNIDVLDDKLETKDGKILVNEYFETNIKDVFAIGDSVYNKLQIKNDEFIYQPQGDVANKHGYLLASNLSGDKRAWKGTYGSFATSYYEIKIAGTGLNLDRAIQLGYNAKRVVMNASTKNSGFEDYKPNQVEIIYDADTNTVLGGYCVGYEAVAQFIDQISIVINQKHLYLN